MLNVQHAHIETHVYVFYNLIVHEHKNYIQAIN